MISASDALARLQEGNRRFVSGAAGQQAKSYRARREELVSGQEPFAAVLGCSDSRVAPEVIFDQGLGDLFVVRVAGNIVTAAQANSIEYAVEYLGARLVVVLGHSDCAAVCAAVEAAAQNADSFSPGLQTLIECIRPGIEASLQDPAEGSTSATVERAVRANIHASVRNLLQHSPAIDRLIRTDALRVLGAEYSLATGLVDFLD